MTEAGKPAGWEIGKVRGKRLKAKGQRIKDSLAFKLSGPPAFKRYTPCPLTFLLLPLSSF